MTDVTRTGASIEDGPKAAASMTERLHSFPKRVLPEGWKIWLTWLLRITVGATFIFSGFVKGVDPWGTIFKINDYLGAMSVPVWPTLVNAGAIAMCVFEFLIGVFILLGCFRRSAPILGLCFMAVMLPLTGWIWYAHPVSDCGCFGDAVVISDAMTFWKNVFLTLGFIWLVKFNRLASCLVTPYLQWVLLVFSGLYLFVLAEIGYLYQPLLDFRPFPVGTSLAQAEEGQTDTDEEYVFVYHRGAEEKIVGENDELPSESDGWEFVETRPASAAEAVGKGDEERHSFRIWSEDEDVTEEYVTGEGPKLWLMMPALNEVSISETWEINNIYDWCERHGVDFFAVVNGSPEEIERWKDLSLAEYPIFNSEDTLIKEVVRGKVALVYTLEGEIKWKSTLNASWRPGFENDSLTDLSELNHDNKTLLRNITMMYLSIILVLVAVSFFKPMMALFRKRRETGDDVTHGDRVHRGE